MNIPERGFYYHYKHDPAGALNDHAYEVLGLAKHSEDDSLFVVYRPLYKNSWQEHAEFAVRPAAMFLEEIEKDGKRFPRFSKITDEKIIEVLKAQVPLSR